ncbi:MAG: carbon-nitrogen hydrolase family protein [Bacteroidota bacterium]
MFKAAVVQAASELFNLEACLQKTEAWVQDAKKQGANLVVFPEAFIPGYPRGLSFGTVVGSRSAKGRKTWLSYWENAVEIPGPASNRLCDIAREAAVWLVMGVIEREPIGGTLYCTLLYIDPSGTIRGKHRKLKPTAAERIIWGEGDGKDLQVIATPFGRMGGLICWENYMPEARLMLYRQGIDIYMAPTADQRDTWQASLIHIACEGRCFVLGCNQYVTKAMYPKEILEWEEHNELPDLLSRGGSVVISPLGQILAGPLWDQEGILYANLDLKEVAMGKLDFDVVGHYSRNDLSV